MPYRWRQVWPRSRAGAAFGLCWFAAADLLDIASAPIRAANPAVTLSLPRPQDIVSLNVKVTLVAALFVSAPFVLSSSSLFVAGGAFGYFSPFRRRSASCWTGSSSRV